MQLSALNHNSHAGNCNNLQFGLIHTGSHDSPKELEPTLCVTGVALDGDTAVLGATGDGQATWSAATIFSRGGNGWQEQQLLLPSDWKEFDLFGDSAAVYEDTVIVGAPSTDRYPGLEHSVGRAYFYERWYEPRAYLPAISLPGGS